MVDLSKEFYIMTSGARALDGLEMGNSIVNGNNGYLPALILTYPIKEKCGQIVVEDCQKELKDFLHSSKIPENCLFNFEIEEFGKEQNILDMLTEHIPTQKYVCTSSQTQILENIRKINKDVTLGVITNPPKPKRIIHIYFLLLCRFPKYSKYDFILSSLQISDLPFIKLLYKGRLFVGPINSVVSVAHINGQRNSYCGISTDRPLLMFKLTQ